MPNPPDATLKQTADTGETVVSKSDATLAHSTSTKLIDQVHDSRSSQTDAPKTYGNQTMNHLQQKGVLPNLALSHDLQKPAADAASHAALVASDHITTSVGAHTATEAVQVAPDSAVKVNVPTERTTLDKSDGPVLIKTPSGKQQIYDGSYQVRTYPNGDQYFEFGNDFKADIKTDAAGTLTMRSWKGSGKDGAEVDKYYADGAVEKDHKDGSGETVKQLPDGSQIVHSWSPDQYWNNYNQAISANGLDVTTQYLNGRTLNEERDATDDRSLTGRGTGYGITNEGYITTPYTGHLTSKGPDANDNYQTWTNFNGGDFIKYDDGVKRGSDDRDLSGTSEVPQRKSGIWVAQ